MLRGERATLRAIERSDIPAFVRWVNDPEVTQFLSQRGPFSLAQEEQWFERQLEKHDGFIFGITTEEGELIGNIGLDAIERKDRRAVLASSSGKRNTGEGAMVRTQCVRCFALPSTSRTCTECR